MSGTTEDRTARLVLLSADGPEQLEQYRAELCTWLDAHPAAPLDGIAHTLRVGREPLRERVALVVGSVAELAARLRDGDGLALGTATAAASGGETGSVTTDDPAEAARLWVTGRDVVLPEPAGDRPARLSLPVPPRPTRRYWIKAPAALADGPCERLLTGAEFYLRDHSLGRIRILPAVAALEFAVAAAEQQGHGRATGIANVLWARPVLVEDEPVRVRLHLAPTADGVSYEVRLADDGPEGPLCSAGTLRFDARPEAPRLDLDAIRARLPRTATAEECYAVFTALGGGYGPSLQGLRAVLSAPGEVLAQVAVPAAADLPFSGFALHPSLLDAMLQACLWTDEAPSAPRARELPFSLDAVEIFGPLPEQGHVHAVRTAVGHDVSLADDQGRVRVRLRAVVTRPVNGAARLDATIGAHLLAQRWQDAPAPAAGRTVRTLLLGGETFTGAEHATADSVFPRDEEILLVHTSDGDPLPALTGLYRSWAAQPTRHPVRVLHVFRTSGGVEDARSQALDGFARSLANEDPQFLVSAVDAGTAALAATVGSEARAAHAFRVRYTADGRQVPRWEPVAPDAAPLTPRGTVLVTGGAGALGRLIVAHLGGDARYVLTGRSPGADLTELRAAGLDVHYVPADLGAPGAAADLVERIHASFGPLHGVLHLAGTTHDALLIGKSDQRSAAVLGPKVRGTVELDRATAGDPLDFFIAFSSMSGAAGSPGQTDYAYANRFLDAFTAWRRGSGRPGRSLSVLWSLWADGGIRVDADEATAARMARQVGLVAMPTEAGLTAFDRALGHDGDHVLVAHGNLARLREVLNAPAPSAPSASAASAPSISTPSTSRVPAARAVPSAPSAQPTALSADAAEEFLRQVLAGVFEFPAEEIEADAPFERFGIDSLLIMDLTRRLEEHFGSLPKTLFFEYQDLRSLAAWFTQHHGSRLAELAPAPEPVTAPAPLAAGAPERAATAAVAVPRAAVPVPAPSGPMPIAIVGVAARFAESDTLDQFWDHLEAGRDLVTEIPADRWDWRDYDQHTPADRAARYSRWGSFLRGIDMFDPLFFGVSPREAEIVDPQERLFLQTAWHAMENAGRTRADLRSHRVGVYVGAMYGLYQLHEAEDGRIGASSHASIANRVSYTLGLTGPSLGVDTMCSSSLTAIHLAVRDLRAGDTDLAVAGGVNLHVHPYKYRFLGQGSFTSSDGRCRSFGADGDGYVPGEGVGAVLLRPLADAVRDGDHIHGVILGTSVNHGGRTNGFTVPNPVAQGDLVARALGESGVDPATLGYLEAHGTGTALGDPVEIRGLARALAAAGLPPGSLPIGSVKSNVGHLESASGMAGLCKVLLQMRHGRLVPSLHADPLNPNIDFDSTPLRVQRDLAPWPRPDGAPRRAGLSSFGAGGANAHLVVEEYVAPATAGQGAGPYLFPLSTRVPERLPMLAAQLADALERGLADGSPPRLADVAFTLQQGREEWADRMVVLASTVTELVARLRGDDPAGVWTGSARGRAASRAAAPTGSDPASTAAAWAAGAPVTWPTGNGSRVPLPGYPFEELRCWLTDTIWSPPAASASPAERSAPAQVHPLLDGIDPAESLDGLTYRTAFGPEHPYIGGHRLGETRLLPAAAVLEMARAAAEAAGAGERLRLSNVRWLRPFIVAGAERTARTRLRRGETGTRFDLRDDTGELLAEGRVETLSAPAGESLDIGAVRARLGSRHEGVDLYADLTAAGLFYGPALRAVEWIAAGDGEALVRLRIPAEAARFAGSALHPSVVDGALHAFAVLRDRDNGPAMVPYALTAAEVHAPVTEHGYAHVRTVGADRYDLTLTDSEGGVRVRLRDLSLRPAPGVAQARPTAAVTGAPVTGAPVTGAAVSAAATAAADELMFVPHWTERPAGSPQPLPAGATTWLVRGPDSAPLAAVLRPRLGATVVELDHDRVATATGRPDHVVFLAPVAGARTDDTDALEAAQERGVLALFRLAKALQRTRSAVRLTVITEDAISTGGESVGNPYAAALHGLALSLAQEHPRWQVTVVDRSSADAPTAGVLDAPAGGPYALRGGVLHHRRLLPVATTPPREGIRPGGTYLVLGGAGGIGLELTDWLVRGYRAKVVLLGRGELDAERRERLRAIDPEGTLVSYRRADATDPAALRGAIDWTRTTHGALHGVFHATIVLRDQTVATMTEETFRTVLAAKAHTSVALHAALRGSADVDFILFFSSAVALAGSAGQGNYAAGSTFEDAFAHHLDGVLDARVAVINWGYWGTVGIVANESHRDRLAATGIHSITPEEGMAAVHAVLGRDDRQVVVVKADAAVLAAVGVQQRRAAQEDRADAGAPSDDTALVPELARLTPVARLLTEADDARLTEIMCDWLWTLFRQEGVFLGDAESWRPAALAERLRIVPAQLRLFTELLRQLTEGGFLDDRGGSLVPTGRRSAEDPEGDLVGLCERKPALNRFDRLLRPCMGNLFGVMRGSVRATDVMFPGGSSALVEGAYQGSPVVDRANELVVGAVQDLLSRHQGPLNVIEIGAGTGGTTASVLPALTASGTEVTYVYTDISRAFLRHGEKRFAQTYPYVSFQRLDISGDPEAQGFTSGSADLVVAANVLHATSDLLATLRAVNRLLKPGGRLVLNEASSNVLTATLTFGLLDGWWLHEDAELRLPGAPLLSASGWRKALALAGFARSRAVPADEGLSQHVVVAQTSPDSAAPPAIAAPHVPQERPAPAQPSEPSEQSGGEAGALLEAAREYVKEAFAQILQVPLERLWLDETYENFGVDSLTVPLIVDVLAEGMGELPVSMLFEYPTIREVADYLVERHADRVRTLLPEPAADLAAEPLPEPPAASRTGVTGVTGVSGPDARSAVPAARPAAGTDHRVAIVGVAGRYPQAADLDTFWDNLRSGRDCVTEVPADRWDHRAPAVVDGQKVGRWGGFLDGIDEFDPRFFQMSLREAELTDPQERLFLQTSWHALEDAGYTRARLRGSRVGVYVGVMYGHYQLFEDERGLAGGMGYASIANRVSYVFDFHGPSLAVDTMCSSSLTAIHLACEALAAGHADYAIAGGVNLAPHPRKYRQLAAGGFTGESGRCRSFAADGDGMVPGEGVGAVLLKPLAAAERDGDRILGVILGSSVNHGGKTGGFAVPSPGAQGEVIAQALRTAGVPADGISYVEAHGTGTALGDPAEVAGLVRAFGDLPAGSVALGSVKSSIGHLESAAGIAALTKVLLQLKARELAPSLHADALNPAVDWNAVPFRVQRELAPWTGPGPLRAGISAFGAGGSNAHLVVEEHPAAAPRPGASAGPAVFPFSARDAEGLRRVVAGMRSWLGPTGTGADPGDIATAAGVPVTAVDEPLDELGLDPATMVRLIGLGDTALAGAVHGGTTLRELAGRVGAGAGADVDLGRLAHTLQAGREAMPHRFAVVARTVAELTEVLDGFLAGRSVGHTGVVTAEPGAAIPPSPADPDDTARRWVRGEVFDWAAAHPAPVPPLSLPGYPFARTRCWIDAVTPAAPAAAAPTASATPAAPAPGTRLRDAVLALLGTVSGYAPADLDPAGSFHEHGLDSLGLIRLADEVSNAFGVPVGPDQLLATPTPLALARWLEDEHPHTAPPLPAAPAADRTQDRTADRTAGDDPVVIVGMAGTLPGARNLDEFWAALQKGGDLFSEVPADRWDSRAHYGDPALHPDRTRITRGGFMPDIDRFDPLFFGISPREARWMDPRQRLLLRTVWSALEDAGIDPTRLAGTDTGLFVGVGSSDYAELVQRSDTATDPYSSTGLTPSMLANRISYHLDLRGPSEPVDTACSSSLVALHRAAEALRLGHCDTVIAGGVSLMLSPVTFASLERAGMLSPDGVGRAFDKNASGYVRGEGVGAVVLKRLSRARADGNPVLAVLRGTAVNHGGRSNSLTAPNPRGQAEVIVRAHREAGVDPATIGYVETHGTGTVIGDPAETNGLRQAFAELYRDWGHPAPTVPHCALGALKNTIGHLEPAAGIAAVLRVLLSMRHGRITGDPHGPELNPHLALEGTACEIAVESRDWLPAAPGVPRRAGVSSFGYGGVNAHVVLEEYPADEPSPAARPAVFALSARDPERLRATARSLADARDSWAHDLAGTAHTLQTGRAEHAERLAFVTDSGEHAVETLRRFLAGDVSGVHLGRVERHADRSPFDGRGDEETAAAWVRGASVDWPARWERTPKLRSLPPYPFAAERYWFTEGAPAAAASPPAAPAAAAPTAPVTGAEAAARSVPEPVAAAADGTGAPAPVSLFTAAWVAEPVPPAAPHPGRVLVFGDLPVPGAVTVTAGSAYADEGSTVTIRPGEAEDYARLLATGADRIVHQWPLLRPERPDLGIESVFLLVRAMAASRAAARIQVLVPEGAMAEAWGGFDTSLRAVLPGTAFGVVRVVGRVEPAALLAEVAAERLSSAAVRLSATVRTVRVLTETDPSPVTESPLRAGGVHLVTGGAGGLGLLLARTLLSRGARVALTGRSSAADRARELAALRALGDVAYFQASVDDRAAMARVVADVKQKWGPLHGVFHLAATASRTPLPGKDLAEFRSHLRARFEGTRVLDEVTRDEPLDLFVLYSSLAGQLGDYGLADYAVGARYLDGFAEEREALRTAGRRNGRTVSVDWPMWRAGGMHVGAEDERRYLADTGFRYLETEEGERLLDLALRLGRPQVAVLPGAPERMRERVEAMRVRERGHRARPAAPAPAAPVRAGELTDRLRELVAELLGLTPKALDPEAGFGEYGLDSFGLQSLSVALEERYGVSVPTTVLFGENTVEKLARHLLAEHPSLADRQETAAAPITEPVTATVTATATVSAPPAAPAAAPPGEDAVAIVGMSGRFPGSADLEEFWRHLRDGRDLITETPADRWDWQEVSRRFGGTARWGGFLSDVDRFDARFFKLSPAEAEVMDPQHRLFLEHTWAALEDAGCRADLLAGRRVSVFAGVQFNDYESMVLRGEQINPHAGTGLARTILTNRISFLLDLKGQSESIDTACSSSLVALHRAVRALRAGESELAVAGGVSLVLSPQTVVAGNQLGVLSPDGRCKALDARADGYVKGEGVGVLVLKPLSRALADGDRVHAVIRGSAVGHGGHASSLTAPNPLAQAALLVEAYRDARVPAGTVSYTELHGTGTALGDPVEIDGLVRAHRTLADGPATPCGIGTVKSNIGHLEPAAGIAGVIKVVLAMRHRTLPRTLHLQTLNPLIDLANTPFQPVRETTAWAPEDADGAPLPLRAGVSSFGFGGVNAHVVLEEAPATAPRARLQGEAPEVFLLSGRDAAALRRYAVAMVEFLDAEAEDGADADESEGAPSLAALAYTSQAARVPMAARLALVARSTRDLREQLAAHLAAEHAHGRTDADHAWLSEPEGADYLARLVREGRLDQLARLWQDGADIDWAALRRGDRPPLTSMPTYPFARERHWLTTETATGAPPAARDSSLLLVKRWEAAPLPPAELPAGVLVLARAENEALATRAFGPSATVVRVDDGDADTARRITEAARRATAVIDLADVSDTALTAPEPDWSRIELLRELVTGNRTRGFAYLHLTRGLTTFRTERPTLRGAAYAGLVRMLTAEYRGLSARTLDLDTLDPAALREAAAAELAATDPVTEACVRAGVRHRPVLRPADGAPASTGWSADLAGGTVVITGGTGALGRLLAARLVERGADRLVLLGRTPLPARTEWPALLADPGTDPALAARLRDLAALERPGVRLVVEAVPLDGIAEVLDRARREMGPIVGVVHCAGLGVMRDPAFIGKRIEDVQRVMEPKTAGLQAVLDGCADDPLRFVVLYSSVAGAVPALAVGMSDYALANSVLDRVAEYRTATGGAHAPVIRSLQWPSWRAAGMPEADTQAYRGLGLRTLDPEAGLDLLDRAMSGSDPVVLPCVVDAAGFDAARLLAVPAPGRPDGTAPAPAPSAAPRGVPAAPGLVRRVSDVIGSTLRLEPGTFGADEEFADLGVDSIMIAQILAALERELGVVAEPSTILENPTVALLAEALRDQVPDLATAVRDTGPAPAPAAATPAAGATPPTTATATVPVPAPAPVPAAPAAAAEASGAPDAGAAARREDLAVIGIAAHFPGAPDHGTFWRNLLSGTDSVTEVPPSRWDPDRFWRPDPQPGTTVSKWGGFLDAIEDFDPEHFRIDPAGAAYVDPLVRQVLETGVECLADAGLTPEQVAGRRVGVFAGARTANFGAHVAAAGPHSISGMAQNFIAAHLSHHLDLRGPAVVVDTACSSALVAVHLAAASLRTGECDLAFATGADILLDEVPFVGMSGAGALSPTGRCHTFDERADGIVLGEGAGTLLLKRVSDAVRDGDRIYAVIEGSAVNNDGRTMGITTPNPRAQREVIEAALADAGVSPAQLGYVEAHGTGTMIGDPMELKALTEAFRARTDEVGFCGVGSVKTNIGHTLSAAGMAGLIKVLLSVHHGQLPPTLHCANLNRRFRFEDSPLFPVREPRGFPGRDGTRRAAVSSFGFGGTNAHMVVRQAPDAHVPARGPLDPPRYERRRFWFDPPARTAARAPARTPVQTPAPPPVPAPAPFFELEFSTVPEGKK
ncbi:SDR family NAD(P)-dependent oxidoreductase [Streptomyces sp. G-G2]|uniref:L-histidine N(alpha)-methyltransferase n=1 Tax=Streptomyces sp. G-G2 TaxID=3046201 RepID=UPI0024B91C69|nr:SDR family NAD(P)-dependent oxidoreductase [Streptomyces sp. G-G2]MDJ0380479.1 L-histidine N(alpha)-methyltransferase [Streptomyces sp. G-G2]